MEFLAPELPASLENFTYGEFASNTAGYFQEGNTSPFLETQNITTEFTATSGILRSRLRIWGACLVAALVYSI